MSGCFRAGVAGVPLCVQVAYVKINIFGGSTGERHFLRPMNNPPFMHRN